MAKREQRGKIKKTAISNKPVEDSDGNKGEGDDFYSTIKPTLDRILCEVNYVHIDITQDSEPFLQADYNRRTIIDLIKYLILLESNPSTRASFDGVMIEPNLLFECSKPHETHSAEYAGDTILKRTINRRQSEIKLLDWINQNKDRIPKRTWDILEMIGRRSENYVRRYFATKIHFATLELIREAILLESRKVISPSTLKSLIHEMTYSPMAERLEVRGRGGATRTKVDWDFSRGMELYNQFRLLHPVWKDAKTLFKQSLKQSARGSRWRQIVKAAHPELPDDLIGFLADLDPYKWNPANLALENAARLCGMKPFTYTPRQLRKKLHKGVELDDIVDAIAEAKKST